MGSVCVVLHQYNVICGDLIKPEDHSQVDEEGSVQECSEDQL